MHRLTLLIPLASLLLLLGCGSEGRRLDKASTEPQATALPALSELDKLPHPKFAQPAAGMRSVSSADEVNWPCAPVMKTTHAEANGADYHLLASGGKLEFAVQRTDAGGLRLTKLQVFIGINSGQAY